jgi:preprotein translocase subunit SecA
LEKILLLRVIDELWVDHLEQMEYLRDSVRLRAYGQRDPLVEYKIEGQRLFNELQTTIGAQVTNLIYKIGPARPTNSSKRMEYNKTNDPSQPLKAAGHQSQTVAGKKEPGRNDPCPCGSGKKYKKCHGNNK